MISTIPNGSGLRTPAVHQPQGVVLLLDQPPTVLNGFVLPAGRTAGSAQHRAMVRAQVAAGVQLGEQPGLQVALDRRPAAGSSRPTQDGPNSDLLDLDAQLVLQGAVDGLAAAAAASEWTDCPSGR